MLGTKVVELPTPAQYKEEVVLGTLLGVSIKPVDLSANANSTSGLSTCTDIIHVRVSTLYSFLQVACVLDFKGYVHVWFS